MQTTSPRPGTLGTALTLLFATPFAAAQDVLVTARQIVVAHDTVLQDSALLLRDGKIAYVGNDIPAEARIKAREVAFGDATISPGFVQCVTTLGHDQDLAEAAIAFTPDLRTAEAFDPWADALDVLPQCCVTSFGLMPSSRNVVGGIGAFGKPGRERGELLVDDAFVGMSLTQNARNPQREPTSLMGASQLLRDGFEQATAGIASGGDLEVLRGVQTGARRAFVHVDTYAEIHAALSLGERFGFLPVLLGARDADKLLPRIAKSSAGVVLGSLPPGGDRDVLELPARLVENGVAIAFAGRPDRMRLSAALAVRHGLARPAALRALTRTPAELLGAESRAGTLRKGQSADFVVFHGDLLDLSARHLATWIDGRPAWTADAPHQKPEGHGGQR